LLNETEDSSTLADQQEDTSSYCGNSHYIQITRYNKWAEKVMLANS